MQIPSYKYTNSNQYSRKLVKLALYLSDVFPQIFILLLTYLNGESEKQNITVRLSNCLAVGLCNAPALY